MTVYLFKKSTYLLNHFCCYKALVNTASGFRSYRVKNQQERIRKRMLFPYLILLINNQLIDPSINSNSRGPPGD